VGAAQAVRCGRGSGDPRRAWLRQGRARLQQGRATRRCEQGRGGRGFGSGEAALRAGGQGMALRAGQGRGAALRERWGMALSVSFF